MPKVAKAAKRPPENTAPLTIALKHGRVATLTAGDAWPRLQIDLRTSDGVAVFQEGKWDPESNWWGGKLEREAFLAPHEVALLRDQANKWVSELCEGLKQTEQVRDAPPIALESWPTDGSGEKTALEVQPDQFVDLLRGQAPHSTNLRWDDADRLAILDVDWHGEKSPTTDDLDRLMREVSPSPFFVHRTRRGFHAGYLALEGFTARELASAAAALMAREPLVATLGGAAEVKSETRHFGATHGLRAAPWRYPGQIEERVPDTHLRVLDELSHAQCSEDERAEIVARLGLTVGHRFDHRHCPLNPERSSASQNPVVAGHNGIFCYSCESRGRGFISWGS